MIESIPWHEYDLRYVLLWSCLIPDAPTAKSWINHLIDLGDQHIRCCCAGNTCQLQAMWSVVNKTTLLHNTIYEENFNIQVVTTMYVKIDQSTVIRSDPLLPKYIILNCRNAECQTSVPIIQDTLWTYPFGITANFTSSRFIQLSTCLGHPSWSADIDSRVFSTGSSVFWTKL